MRTASEVATGVTAGTWTFESEEEEEGSRRGGELEGDTRDDTWKLHKKNPVASR